MSRDLSSLLDVREEVKASFVQRQSIGINSVEEKEVGGFAGEACRVPV